MRRTIPAAVAALAGALTLAACSGTAPSQPGAISFSPGPTLTFSPEPAISASATAIPTTPVPAPRPTISQASAAYLRIAAPVNRAAAAVNADLVYGVPFALLRGDALAYMAALRKSVSQLRAIRWPARVQGYVTAMLLTYDPASIACAKAVASAGSNRGATAVLNTNPACVRSRNAGDSREIRVLLQLPPAAGYLPGI
jgi:hypothetical protein